MNIYKVIYEDDLCYCYTSWFFNLDTAQKIEDGTFHHLSY